MKAGLTQEETTFLRTLYGSGDDNEAQDEAPGDCMECGKQIDSARQIKYEGAILCAKCASIVVSPDTCNKDSV